MPDVRGSTGSPTVRRRELGVMLRALRNRRGLTVEQAAAELLCSPSKVSRMETGQRGATARDIRDLCELYGVTDASERDRLTTLAREGKQQGWWQNFSVPLPHITYVGLEQEATSMRVFHSSVVPGILQTADYIRAIHRNGIPRLDDSAIEERVAERSKRREILNRETSPQFEVILDEAVLHRPLGGQAVMFDQLSLLLEEMKRPNVKIQVLPYAIGAHPALESNFTILDFPNKAPTVIYVEGLVGQIYLERQQDVDRYLLALEQLNDMALSPQDSALLVARIRDTYTKR